MKTAILIPAYRNLKSGHADTPVAVTPEVSALLEQNAVVAIGVSGGKDSDACAIAVSRYLDQIRHQGPRVLVHSDLGRIEWADSLPSCERLAARLGWELMVVRRNAGDMMDRWLGRWANNVRRYNDLSCVKIILPWSTPSMRFCTSEMKVTVITSALKKRFPGQHIINAAGIRRQESENRRRMPVSSLQPKLQRKGLAGINWNPIIEWPVEDVFATIESAGLRLHEAYTIYGASRVSCPWCIMSSANDLQAAAGCAGNHEVYREMVELEIDSTFAFQGSRYLGDTAPHLLTESARMRLAEAKRKALERQKAEAMIPKHLLYKAGWPEVVPSVAEAELIAGVRSQVARLLNLDAGFLTGKTVRARYADLIDKRNGSSTEPLEDVPEWQADLALALA
ncbi:MULTISPECIES: phosphoadenosine phosphosulfate reductase family protein [Acidithiobacillus]|uniref:Phosphoadenosine phosphosulphate reductase domain-containing protein n=2 Tax=Acidithiobacillus TaxID=119977 RepID=A0A179BPZ7_ACIFR|nr:MULTISPECIES: phosphoadenosine phosphosulfate reductase family protein [Acidithiobacillus]MEB8488211.1 phosphoadenosine phosphosulfate reductase family protein [Acidithiobacillus ferriphilus]MEB8491443.1 phosphoadenosine phosphosulfate reductase family protein [Acidithiobacillus ferriphilus]MEB8492241.1 phosphoadenosine phosphosulfate reductase family protein [Acidithiobacillus ferriphilus]MEB8513544.1 phosphoadenosine phosphosulfate reductase family protein [Acidithiobacillus ferriphilus]M